MHSNRAANFVKIYLVVIFLMFSIGISTSYADFYVISGGSKKVGKEIISLPFTISSSGYYFITKNLTCPSGEDGIIITASNVTLDLMGFSLIGPDDGLEEKSGIRVKYANTNIEVRNGVIRDFGGHGYVSRDAGAEKHRLFHLRIDNNKKSGATISGENNIIQNCTCSHNNEDGIKCGKGSTIKGNTCYQNGFDGIDSQQGCTVIENTCYKNELNGIHTQVGCTVTCNTCYDNDENGIKTSYGSTVIGNTCRMNENHGIYLAGDSYVGQNTCTENTTNINDCPQQHPCSKGLNYAP